MRWPTDSKTVTSGDCGVFGAPRPKCREVMQGRATATRKHAGIDLRARTGDNIYAILDGTCTFAGYQSQSGNVNATQEFASANQYAGNGGIMCFIRHQGGMESRYMHLSVLGVQLGDVVKEGDIVGLAGDTGDAKGEPHLHFEIIENGTKVDPLPILKKLGTGLGPVAILTVGLVGAALMLT